MFFMGFQPKEIAIQNHLKQGDSLAPFLFVVVAEGLSCLISRPVELCFLKGLR